MNDKYDVKISEEKILNAMHDINDYCVKVLTNTDLENIELKAIWAFNTLDGERYNCEFIAKKTTYISTKDGQKISKYELEGQLKYLGIYFPRDIFGEGLSYNHRKYALSLIDNWKIVKEQLQKQLETAKSVRKTVEEFVV